MPSVVQKVFDSAGTVGVNGVDFVNFNQVKSFMAGYNCATTDTNLEILIKGILAFPGDGFVNMGGVNATCRAKFKAHSASNVNLLERTTLNKGAAGGAVQFTRGGYPSYVHPGIDFEDLRVLVVGTSGNTATAFYTNNANNSLPIDTVFRRCRFYDSSLGTGTSLKFGIGESRVLIEDCFGLVDGVAGKTLWYDNAFLQVLRSTFVATGVAGGATKFLESNYSRQTLSNNIFLGFTQLYVGVPAGNLSNNLTNVVPTTGQTIGYTLVAGANGIVVDDTADYRPKAAGPAIGMASAAAISMSDILGNNRGPSPDVGAWQLTPYTPKPTATITTKTINGASVTYTGTTTNNPTSGKAKLAASGIPYNSAVTTAEKDVTLGNGTFSVTFDSLKVGQLDPVFTFTNSGGTSSATNDTGVLSIVSATGAVTSQTLNGQVLTINFTTSGSPVSGEVLVPALASNPAGAFAIGPVAVTLNNGAGTGQAVVNLTAGNFDKAVIRLTNADGTSLPLTGASLAGVSIIGISGNPEAPAEPEPTPAITGVTIDPPTATGSGTFNATATAVNGADTSLTWETTAGTIANGMFVAPAKTNAIQTVTITARSVFDPTKFATATVTIAALVIVLVPAVVSVSISPKIVAFTGSGTQQFNASAVVVDGADPDVEFETSAGTIDETGFLTVAATNVIQTVTVTARSLFDPTKVDTATVFVPALAIVPDPDPDPVDPEPDPVADDTTSILCYFVTPEGEAVPDADVEIQLSRAGFDEEISGIAMPRAVYVKTDEEGKVLIDLMPSDTLYYITVLDTNSEAVIAYKFYVPKIADQTVPVRLQDIVVAAPMSGTSYDDAALLLIHNVKAAVLNAKAEVLALRDTLNSAVLRIPVAGPTPPPNPVQGLEWVNTTTAKRYTWFDGTPAGFWVETAGAVPLAN